MKDLRWLDPDERLADETREYGSELQLDALQLISEEYARFDTETRKRHRVETNDSLYASDRRIGRFLSERLDEQDGSSARLDHGELSTRLYRAWLARAVGCTLGKPVEDWPLDATRRFLDLPQNRDLETYLSAADLENTTEFRFAEFNRAGLRENLRRFPEDDDIDYTIINLTVAERYGDSISSDLIIDAWTRMLPISVLCTAERVAYQNASLGLVPPETAFVRNPYRQWIGALIRADLWGYINPGLPEKAAMLAYIDARVSHTGEGVWGAVWVAVLLALILGGTPLSQAIHDSMAYIEPTSAVYDTVATVIARQSAGIAIDEVTRDLLEPLKDYSWVHVLPNVAIIALALVYHGDDIRGAWYYALHQGLDTDSNCATIGSILGATGATVPEGFLRIPERAVTTSIPGHDGASIEALAARTTALIGTK